MARVINKTKGFGTINRDCVFDNQLSDRARFVYVYMACKPETWDFYQDKVAEEIGYKKDTLRKYLDELIVRGWLTEKDQQNDGKFGCLEYVIEVERKKGNLPIRKKPDTEKTRIGKSSNHINIDNISSDINISSDKRNIEKEDNNKSLSSKNKRFIKPTIEEIQAYINEKKYHFSAESFYHHYESIDWKVGKNKMTKWKSACATWELMRKEKKEEEKEEEPAIELPEGMTQEQWENISNWMVVKIKHIAGKITPVMLAQMKKDVNGNSQLLNNILCDLDYKLMDFCNYDLYDEFKKLLSTDEYQQQL